MKLTYTTFFPFLIIITVSCQFEDGTSNTSISDIDSVQYVLKTRVKEVGDCESLKGQCAKIKIQTIDIKSGISDKSAVNIELDIEREILMIEGDEVSASKSVEELIDLLIEEYQNLISDLKDYNLPWEINYSIEVLNNRKGLFSVMINSYSYRGGAHGMSYSRYLNYNLLNGHRITIDSAFTMDKAFLKICENAFRSQFNIDASSSLNEGRFNFPNDQFFLPDNFIIQQNKVIFKYNIYDIAPYYEGIIEYVVDLDQVYPFIKSELLKGFISGSAPI